MDRKDRERELASSLLSRLYPDTISDDQMARGFRRLLQFAEVHRHFSDTGSSCEINRVVTAPMPIHSAERCYQPPITMPTILKVGTVSQVHELQQLMHHALLQTPICMASSQHDICVDV